MGFFEVDRLLVYLNRANRYVARLLGRRVELVHERIWLGLLRDRHLEAITNAYYDRANDLVGLEYNQKGLSSAEETLVTRWVPASGRALVLGAGGGREGIGLAYLGFKTTLIDTSAYLVEAARSNLRALGLGGTVLHRPPHELLLGIDDRYDLIVLGLGVYSHILGSRKRLSLMRQLASLSHGDTVLMLSVYPARSEGTGWSTALSSLVSRLTLNPRRPERGERLREAFTRAFTDGEIEDELGATGWQLVDRAERGFQFCAARKGS